MLAHRFATGLILTAAFVAVLVVDEWLAPWFPLWLLTAAVVLGQSTLEVVGLLNATGARPSGNTAFGGVLALVGANWAPHLADHLARDPRLEGSPGLDPSAPVAALAWPLWAFVGVLMVAFIVQSVQFQAPGRTMATIAGTVLTMAYVGLLGSFILQLRWLEGPSHGLVPLVMLVATAKGADTGAYTLGRLAGRHKLWPRLSPNKTVEGALGGLAVGVLAAAAVTAIAGYGLKIPTLSWPVTIGFGLLVGTAAQLGDLMESMIKRDCSAKDASTTLPGFGGVLDVVDSLLFAGPVAFGYWLWFGPP